MQQVLFAQCPVKDVHLIMPHAKAFSADWFDGSKLTISITKGELVEVMVTTAEGLFSCASRMAGKRLYIKLITCNSAYDIYSAL